MVSGSPHFISCSTDDDSVVMCIRRVIKMFSLYYNSLSIFLANMSSFSIISFFCIHSGVRNDTDQHMHYSSALSCSSSPPFPAKLQKFATSSEKTLEDMTIVFLITKAFIPPLSQGGPILLDAVQMQHEPGDPTDKMYELFIPDFPHPTVFALGSVSELTFKQPGLVVIFSLVVSEYVRGTTQTTTIEYVSFLYSFSISLLFTFPRGCRCRLDKVSTRWRNTPPPLRGAQVFVIATCREQLENRHLCIDLLGITYIGNAATLPPPAPLSSDCASKKRKFAALAPPRPPLADQQELSSSSPENATVSTSQLPTQRGAILAEFITA